MQEKPYGAARETMVSFAQGQGATTAPILMNWSYQATIIVRTLGDEAMTQPAPTPAPNLAQIARAVTVPTRSGVTLSVRQAFAEDEHALAVFFDAVLPEDRRFRFLAAAGHLDHDRLAPMTHVDHWRTESFLAFDQATGELVASAVLACDAEMETGEVAISVRGDYRGRGVGWGMLNLVAAEGERRGLSRVIAIEDRANHAAIELEKDCGFVAHGVEGDPHIVMLEKTLR
jgi:acetyltransferase